MKKLITLLLLFSFALSGCAAQQQTQDGETLSEVTAEAQSQLEAGELVMLSDCTNGGYYMSGYRSSRGVYECERQSGRFGNYCRIDFIDMQSASRSPICHLEGCAHDTPECGAFIEAASLYRLYNYEDLMFIVYNEPLCDAGDPKRVIRPAGIDIAEIDGAKRRPLVRYDFEVGADEPEEVSAVRCVGALSISSPLFCDGRYLYFFLSEITGANHVPVESQTGVYTSAYEYERYIVTLDLVSGEELSRMPYRHSLTTASGGTTDLYRGKLLSSGIKLDSNGEPIQSDTDRQYTICYYTTDLKTGGESIVFEDEVDMNTDWSDSGDIMIINGELYSARGEAGALYHYEPDTGEYVKVFEAPGDWSSFFCDYYGGKYLFTAWLADGSSAYFISQSFDSPLEPFEPLSGPDVNTGRRMLRYLCESETDFLLCTDYAMLEEPGVSSSGEPCTVGVIKRTFALISKSDYWSGIPNYRDITEN
ncbi:MAG: hypothetical protein Q4B42_02370 [Oscillospiraceae bacterium]|nr:hypothetical protein [Oscillospiraceae bacterium]